MTEDSKTGVKRKILYSFFFIAYGIFYLLTFNKLKINSPDSYGISTAILLLGLIILKIFDLRLYSRLNEQNALQENSSIVFIGIFGITQLGNLIGHNNKIYFAIICLVALVVTWLFKRANTTGMDTAGLGVPKALTIAPPASIGVSITIWQTLRPFTKRKSTKSP